MSPLLITYCKHLLIDSIKSSSNKLDRVGRLDKPTDLYSYNSYLYHIRSFTHKPVKIRKGQQNEKHAFCEIDSEDS